MSGGAFVFILLILGVIMWVNTGRVGSLALIIFPMACIIPTVMITMTGVSYLHFWYAEKMRGFITRVGETHPPKDQPK